MEDYVASSPGCGRKASHGRPAYEIRLEIGEVDIVDAEQRAGIVGVDGDLGCQQEFILAKDQL